MDIATVVHLFVVCPLDLERDGNSGASEIRPATVNFVPCFDQQTEPQDCGFIQPSGDQLYVDRQLLRAEVKRHGESRQTGQVERHRGTHRVGRRHFMAVDDVAV
jgi:hypothetical protein